MTLPGNNLSPATQETSPQLPPQPRRILLIEDHADTVALLTRLLERNGFQVTAANTAAEALTLADHRRFDLILSDIHLPDGEACELLPQLRQTQGNIPALALSGSTQPAELAHQRQAGFSATLTKPCSLTEIMTRLHEALTPH